MTRTRNRERTRQKILAAARRLIAKGGFVRLTTREIAQQAGCAEGTLFKHFQRKEDLCLAVVLENSPTFRSAISGKHPGTGSVSKNLEDMALAAIRFSDQLIPMAAVLLADPKLLARHRKALLQRGRGPDDVLERIAAYVSGEQRLGRLRRDVAPVVVGAALLGSCFHRAFTRQVMGRNLVALTDHEFAAALAATLTTSGLPR